MEQDVLLVGMRVVLFGSAFPGIFIGMRVGYEYTPDLMGMVEEHYAG